MWWRTDYQSLPPQRRKVMDFLLAEAAAGRPFPTRAEIARHMGWKYPASAADVLQALAGSKFIARVRAVRTAKQDPVWRFEMPTPENRPMRRRELEAAE